MKNLALLPFIFFSLFISNTVIANDDVYDKPMQKKEKVKNTYRETTPTNSAPAEVEKTVPYQEVETTNTNRTYNDNDDYSNSNEYYSNDYSSDFGYSNRIRRFHNPSIRFNYSYGWNNYYDPYSSYNQLFGWNDWNSYVFTPSWMHNYSNFYNQFWSSATIIFIQPGFNSWYNSGYYSPWNSWNNWNYNYGFSPYCNNIIYNNYYNGHPQQHHYGNYGDNNYSNKNIVNTPRTGTYSNTPSNNNNNNSTNSNNNNGGWNVNNNSNSNNTTTTKSNKWTDKKDTDTPKNNGNNGWSNPYKNNNTNSNNGNENYSKPSNNNGNWNNNNSNNNSGIKIGSRPK